MCFQFEVKEIDYSMFSFSVFGALLGKQNGRNLELCNSFELQHCETDDDCVIDMDYFQNKEEQCMFNIKTE